MKIFKWIKMNNKLKKITRSNNSTKALTLKKKILGLKTLPTSKSKKQQVQTQNLLQSPTHKTIKPGILSELSHRFSNNILSRYLNTSLDEDIQKLESLRTQNIHARHNWISIEQRIIELEAKKKLKPLMKIQSKHSFSNSQESIPTEFLKKYDFDYGKNSYSKN